MNLSDSTATPERSMERLLREARQRRQRWFAMAAIGIFMGVCSAVLVFVVSGVPIKVEPTDAAAYAEIRASGMAVVVGETAYFLGETQVLVEAAGFYPRTLPVTSEDRVLLVALEPIPGTVTLTTVPVEEGVQWEINGQPASVGASLERELSAGEYRIDAWHPYYEPETREIILMRGERAEFVIPLRRVTGRVSIRSEPPGARVTVIIGRERQERSAQTPLVRSLRAGKYPIRVELAGYAPITDEIELTLDHPEVQRNYRLTRPMAQLRIAVSPPGGALLVDGLKVNPQVMKTVSALDKHEIVYRREGYLPHAEQIRLNASETRTVEIRLTREIGEIEIKTQPTAEVWLDGKLAGNTPLLVQHSAQTVRIELRRKGYVTIRHTVTPTSAHLTTVHETLQTEQAVRSARAPKEYTNGAGITLKLFRPTEVGFVLGAPRSELGQRANEYERKVKLQRPFYAALHEVTEQQFQLFRPDYPQTDYPVVSISWDEAARFCNWLSSQENRKPFYVEDREGNLRAVSPNADGYRLLSEAEWEWLARKAGRQQKAMFAWEGNPNIIPPEAGNIADESAKAARGLVKHYTPRYTDGFERLAPVGSFPASPAGLFDLAGNAAEWTHDFYLIDTSASGMTGTVPVDPLGPDYGDGHVLKGSSWRTGTRRRLRAAYREGLADPRDDVGFRVGRYL